MSKVLGYIVPQAYPIPLIMNVSPSEKNTRIKDDIYMGLFPPKIKRSSDGPVCFSIRSSVGWTGDRDITKKEESIILHKHRDPCQVKDKKKEKKKQQQTQKE